LLLSPEPLFFDDTLEDKRADPAIRQVLQRQNIRALAALPLVLGRQQIGALLLEAEEPHHFTPHEIDLTLPLVGQLAAVVENRRLCDETQANARREHQLRELALSITASADVPGSWPSLANLVRQLVPADVVALITHAAESPKAVLQALHAVSPARPWAKPGDMLPLKGSGVGWVAAHAAARLEKNVPDSMACVEDTRLAQAGLASRLILPMSVGGQVTGALDLASAQPGAFVEAHAALLQPIADQIALTLERARLLQETRAALAEVEATTRRYLRQQWASYLAGTREQRNSLAETPLGALPGSAEWTPEMEQALVLGKTIVVDGARAPDGQPARAALAVPIKVRGQPIGVLDFYDEGERRVWDQEELALVEALADQIALALENARLFEQTQQRAQREQLIAQASARMRATQDMEGVLRTTVREIRRALGATHGVIRLGADLLQSSEGDGYADEQDS